MKTIDSPERMTGLLDELQNFQEIANYLDPSPGDLPSVDGIDVCGLSMPLGGVAGGDHIIYLDFKRRYDLPSRIAEAEAAGRSGVAAKLRDLERRAGILVADVSGHRMTDALIAAMLHQAFLLGVYYELDQFGEITTRIFEHMNTRFFRTTAINKYFTMIYGEIFEDGMFRFLTAGHRPPAVFSREYGRFMGIAADRLISFPPMGMLPTGNDPDGRVNSVPYRHKKRYEINELSLLSPGDILVVSTDGLNEHADGTYFPSRLEALLAGMRDATSAEICGALRKDLLDHGPTTDDISVVVIRRSWTSGP